MCTSEYKATLRSDWSEFSLRARPSRVQPYQAGIEARQTTVKHETGHETPRYSLRYSGGEADNSIENDVFVILMSYPEGQQRLLERMAEQEKKQRHDNKKQLYDNKKQLYDNKKPLPCQPSQHIPPLDKTRTTRKSINKHRILKNTAKSWSEMKKMRLKHMLAKYTSSGKQREVIKCQSSKILKVSDIYTSSDDDTDELESDDEQLGRGYTTTDSDSEQEQLGRRGYLSADSDSEGEGGTCSSGTCENDIDDTAQGAKDDAHNAEDRDVEVVATEEGCGLMDKSLRGECTSNRASEEGFGLMEKSLAGDCKREDKSRLGTEDCKAGVTHMKGEDRPDSGELADVLTKDNCCGPLANLEDLEQSLFGNSELSFLEMLTTSDVIKPCLDRQELGTFMERRKDDKEAPAVGSLVWGRFSKVTWWPGIIIQGPMAGQREARPGWTWMMWFGDFTISEMRLSQVEPFTRDFRQKCQGKRSDCWESAIVQALQECCRRAGLDVGDYESMRVWGLQGTRFTDLVQAAEDVGVDLFTPGPGKEFPSFVAERLEQLRHENERDLLDNPAENNEDRFSDAVCLSCGKFGRQLLSDHPLFEGKVCNICQDVLQETLLLLDNDGCNMFCVVCGGGEELFVCEEEGCGKSFCVECIQESLEEETYLKVREMSPWLCFLCTMYSESTHGDLIPRLNWPHAMVSFYNEHLSHPAQIADELPPLIGPKQRLRVLSLCDGIAATLVALQTLGVDMETYYACETDPEAIQVVQFQQPNCVTNIGSVYDLNKEKLKTLLPLHLVVCNLPGEDCDVNHDPDTGGFNGGGLLACKLLLILKDITVLGGLHGEPLWLLTTPATLTTHITTQIAHLFQSGPRLWDAEWFSALHCPVFVWGNLPNIHSSCQYADSSQKSLTLDSCLVRSLNRTARVPKLRLCAVMKQGKQPVLEDTREATGEPVDDVGAGATVGIRSNMHSSSASFTYPVLMDNKPCGIWTIEIERAIGLPDHYTDISKLGTKERMCLLKQTPSVVLLTHLLKPLTERFAMRQE